MGNLQQTLLLGVGEASRGARERTRVHTQGCEGRPAVALSACL